MCCSVFKIIKRVIWWQSSDSGYPMPQNQHIRTFVKSLALLALSFLVYSSSSLSSGRMRRFSGKKYLKLHLGAVLMILKPRQPMNHQIPDSSLMKSQTISSKKMPVDFCKNLTILLTILQVYSATWPPLEWTILDPSFFFTLVMYLSFSVRLGFKSK